MFFCSNNRTRIRFESCRASQDKFWVPPGFPAWLVSTDPVTWRPQQNAEWHQRKIMKKFISIVTAGTLFCLVPMALPSAAQEAAPATSPQRLVGKLSSCTPNGEFYLCGTPDGRIKCTRTRDGAALITVYMCQPESIAVSPDGRYIAAIGRRGTTSQLKVWEIATGSLLWKLGTESGSELLRFSADGKFLASKTGESSLHLWDLKTGVENLSELLPARIFYMAFTGEECDSLIAVCENGEARWFAVQ